jgi:hypothetical protein
MHTRGLTAILVILICTGLNEPASAQTPALDSLRRGLSATAARIDSLEAGLCPGASNAAAYKPSGNAGTDSLAATLERLNRRVEALRLTRCPAAPGAQIADSSDDLAALRAAAAAAAGQAPPAEAGDSGQRKPSEDDGAAQTSGGPRGANLLNPEISATGDVRLVGEEGGRARGEAHEFEFAFQSALDPYASTKIFLAASEDGVEIEEGYIYYTGLPGRLRLDLGKFRQQVGDLNRWHAHALPETEYPLVYQRYLSPEGLSGVGLSLYTNLPFSLLGATHEVWLQGTSAESGPMLGGTELLLLGRVQNFWQLNRSTYAQLGFTGMGGDNSGVALQSRTLGADFRITYRPPEAGTRRDVTFRAEAYRLRATESGTTTNRYGTFLDLSARTSQRWIFGARYDHVEAPRGLANTEWRIVPNITWWQSEFVYLRLEAEHRHTDLEGSHNLLTFQAVWAMGPHKHETY